MYNWDANPMISSTMLFIIPRLNLIYQGYISWNNNNNNNIK